MQGKVLHSCHGEVSKSVTTTGYSMSLKENTHTSWCSRTPLLVVHVMSVGHTELLSVTEMSLCRVELLVAMWCCVSTNRQHDHELGPKIILAT